MITQFLFILLINFLLYYRTANYKYVSDDIPCYQKKREEAAKTNKWVRLFKQFRGDYRFDPRQDHCIAIAVHALTCAMLYVAFGANEVSFLAAILFSINPSNNQVAVWISGRGYGLALLLLLCALAMPFLSPLFMVLACSFHTAFASIFAFIGCDKPYILWFIPLALFYQYAEFKRVVKWKIENESYTEDRRFHLKKIVLAIKTFGFYLALALIPFRITFYHSFLQSCSGNEIMRKRAYSLRDKFFWIGALSFIAWVVLALRSWSITTWGVWWFIVGIAPYCNLIRLNQEIAERYIYFANAGLMLAFASVIINHPMVITVFVTLYLVRSWYTMPMFRDDYWVLEHAVIEDPGSWFAWHIRGMTRWDKGAFKEALIMWVMARMISPKEFKLLVNIAIVLRLLKQEKEAEEFLQLAEQNVVEGQEEKAKEIIENTRKGTLNILL